jgi:hypothetical protein
MSAIVNRRGKKIVQTIGDHQIYEYRSPGITLPNENKSGEELAKLSSGVTTTYLSQSETERYLKNRRIGKFSKVTP